MYGVRYVTIPSFASFGAAVLAPRTRSGPGSAFHELRSRTHRQLPGKHVR